MAVESAAKAVIDILGELWSESEVLGLLWVFNSPFKLNSSGDLWQSDKGVPQWVTMQLAEWWLYSSCSSAHYQ